MAKTDLIPRRSTKEGLQGRDYRPFRTLREEINSLFDQFWQDRPDFRMTEMGQFRPSLDVTEDESQYLVSIEVPGLDEKNLNLTIDQGVLTISGDKKRETTEERKGRSYYERSYGSFQRSIPLPAEVEEDKIEANLKNGVLTVRLPKSEEARRESRRIAVTTS